MDNSGCIIVCALGCGIFSVLLFEFVLIPNLQSEIINILFSCGYEMIEAIYSVAQAVLPHDIAEWFCLDVTYNNGMKSLNLAHLLIEFIPGFGIGGVGGLVFSRR